jgi:hypothetical protein
VSRSRQVVENFLLRASAGPSRRKNFEGALVTVLILRNLTVLLWGNSNYTPSIIRGMHRPACFGNNNIVTHSETKIVIGGL